MNRKVKTFFLTIVVAFMMMVPVNVSASQELPDNYSENKLNLNVKSAIAIDSKTGQLLYGKNINQPLPIASMTKLITVYLTLKAIDEKKITWDTKVEPTRQIVAVSNNRAYSNVPLRLGHSYTVRQLYQATLIESANGAAMMLAHAVSESQVDFVKLMRQQLQKWGINDASIYTVCGLPNKSVGTDAYPGADENAENMLSAKDMAIVGQRLIRDFPEVIKTTKIVRMNFVDRNLKTPMTNFNWMLKGLSQYHPHLEIDGLKTGTTDAAGACLIATAKHAGARIITVVMGARHHSSTDPARFIQTGLLFNYIFQNYRPLVFNENEVIMGKTTMKVHNGQAKQVNIGMKNKNLIWIPRSQSKLEIGLTAKEVEAPVKRGQSINSYYLKSGANKLISLQSPNGIILPAKALQSTDRVNFLVQFWRWLFGG